MTGLPRTPSFRLDGRRALVTGASRGIGLGCAVALAEAGAHVVCAARGQAALDETTTAMTAAGLSVEDLALDVSQPESAAAAIAASGPFDILVGNAGLARHAPMVETAVADFDAVMDVNLRGVYFTAQAVARGMIAAKKGGSIITISSQMGHVGGVDRTVYAASKHAIEGMTKSAAIELGPHGIRVNSVAPGFVETNPATRRQWASYSEQRQQQIIQAIAMRRLGTADEIAKAALFFASDLASFVNGQVLAVDGGK